jgi:hypothetical protein
MGKMVENMVFGIKNLIVGIGKKVSVFEVKQYR